MSQASAIERYMLELINEEREARGLNPLQLELRLNESSEDHSDWMIDVDQFSHTGANGSSPTARMKDAGFEFSGSYGSGENIAFQSLRGAEGLQDDVRDLHNSLMNSPGHRANILNPDYEVIGIGLEQGDYQGFDALFVTQNFAYTDADLQVDNAEDVPTDTGDDDLIGDGGDDSLDDDEVTDPVSDPDGADDETPPVYSGDDDKPTDDGSVDTPVEDEPTEKPVDDGQPDKGGDTFDDWFTWGGFDCPVNEADAGTSTPDDAVVNSRDAFVFDLTQFGNTVENWVIDNMGWINPGSGAQKGTVETQEDNSTCSDVFSGYDFTEISCDLFAFG